MRLERASLVAQSHQQLDVLCVLRKELLNQLVLHKSPGAAEQNREYRQSGGHPYNPGWRVAVLTPWRNQELSFWVCLEGIVAG